MASVRLQQVSKVFRGAHGEAVPAVRDVSLTVADRELLVIVGPSGCGKTTLLRLIAGLETPSSGTIAIDNRVMNDVEPKDRDIAMVFQNHALFPHLTVFENLALGLKLRKVPRSEIEQRVGGVAALLDLTGLLDRLPRALSGGEHQRVALGRAIVRRPKVFLFDEPLSDLDATLRTQMRMELARLHDRLNATMIHVTHDQVEAMTLGDRIVVMDAGEIQQEAEPLELYLRPANRFVAGFIGSPPMNLIEGRLEGGAQFVVPACEEGTEALRFLLPAPVREAIPTDAQRLILGLRAKALQPVAEAPKTEGDYLLPAEVELVERLGAETLLHVRTGSLRLASRVEGASSVRAGATVSLRFRMEQASFFDAATGKALAHPNPPPPDTRVNLKTVDERG
ncbi:MAG: ATP-binding cassette domain-containing protein [Verrucomicrobiales bacterium]|nr:ATP-binding cassette domain-containing protein [Verrucomicrobiales bacterium]